LELQKVEFFIYRNQFSCDDTDTYTIFLRSFLSPIHTAFTLTLLRLVFAPKMILKDPALVSRRWYLREVD